MTYRWREWKAAVRATAPERGVVATANGLVLFADHATGETTVGVDTLREETGLALGTTYNHLRWLEARGLLREERGGGKRRFVLTTPEEKVHAGVDAAVETPRQDGNSTVAWTSDDASETPRCRGNSTLPCEVHAGVNGSVNAGVNATVGSSRGVPYEHQGPQEHQEHSRPAAGERAPARATREAGPAPAADPTPPDTDRQDAEASSPPRPSDAERIDAIARAVRRAYIAAAESRGSTDQGRHSDARAVVELVRAEVGLDVPPAEVERVAVGVTGFYGRGYEGQKRPPLLSLLARPATFRVQLDMWRQDDRKGTATASAPVPAAPMPPPPPPRVLTEEDREAGRKAQVKLREIFKRAGLHVPAQRAAGEEAT